MLIAAWRGREAPAFELIDATVRDPAAIGATSIAATYATSVLQNGLGRHEAALDAARRLFEHEQVGHAPFVVPELAEAASRTGDVASLRAALDWLSERTRVTRSEWALGMEARVRALLSEGEAADCLYRESIERLSRTPIRVEVRARPPALRRVVASREQASRRAPAAANCPRDVRVDGDRGIR